jgi:DNA polymerase I-like protein with 3'-5' exonuclease and polymerase domains
MADSHPRLFDDWSEVESDHAFILAAMEERGFQSEFADLALADQQLALAMALCKKRAWRMHLIGRA